MPRSVPTWGSGSAAAARRRRAPATGTADWRSHLYNVYPTSDGHIAIICVGENQWHALLRAMDREDLLSDARFSSLKNRVAHMDEIDALVGGFTAAFGKQQLFDLLIRHRVPCAPVRDLHEVVTDPHAHARGALEWVDHPLLGRVVLPHSPLRFHDSEMLPIEVSGALGRDNQAVYAGVLGLSDEEIRQLREEDVI